MLVPNMDRRGDPYVCAEIRVPVEDVFEAGERGEVRVEDAAGGFDLDLAELGELLEGECHRCGAGVDHRRGVEVDGVWRVSIEIAVVPPVERTWQEPESTGDALELGWSVAAVCVGCRREEVRGRFDLVMERWREEGKIRR